MFFGFISTRIESFLSDYGSGISQKQHRRRHQEGLFRARFFSSESKGFFRLCLERQKIEPRHMVKIQRSKWSLMFGCFTVCHEFYCLNCCCCCCCFRWDLRPRLLVEWRSLLCPKGTIYFLFFILLMVWQPNVVIWLVSSFCLWFSVKWLKTMMLHRPMNWCDISMYLYYGDE